MRPARSVCSAIPSSRCAKARRASAGPWMKTCSYELISSKRSRCSFTLPPAPLPLRGAMPVCRLGRSLAIMEILHECWRLTGRRRGLEPWRCRWHTRSSRAYQLHRRIRAKPGSETAFARSPLVASGPKRPGSTCYPQVQSGTEITSRVTVPATKRTHPDRAFPDRRSPGVACPRRPTLRNRRSGCLPQGPGTDVVIANEPPPHPIT